MEITKMSKVKDIEKIPGVIEIIKKHTGQELNSIMMKMASLLTLQAAARQLNWSDEILEKCIADFNAAQPPAQG